MVIQQLVFVMEGQNLEFKLRDPLPEHDLISLTIDYLTTMQPDIGIMVRVFTRRPGIDPRSSHTKESKNGT